MKLSEFVQPALIKVGLEAKDKWDAIIQLIDLMIEAGQVKAEHRENVIDVVFDRERSMSTGMERGIAIPHANSPLIEDVVGAIGISKTGIPFDSLDGKPSDLIVLLVIPKDKFQKHVRTLAGIARLFNHDQMTGALRNAESAEEVMQIIVAEEGKDMFYS
jgi:mannitol/fructose-specific phosphotransferase system IIA component (Ntr-type)